MIMCNIIVLFAKTNWWVQRLHNYHIYIYIYIYIKQPSANLLITIPPWIYCFFMKPYVCVYVFFVCVWGMGNVRLAIEHHAFKTNGELKSKLHIFLQSTQIGRETSVSCAGCLVLSGRSPIPTDRLGFRAALEAEAQINSCHFSELIAARLFGVSHCWGLYPAGVCVYVCVYVCVHVCNVVYVHV